MFKKYPKIHAYGKSENVGILDEGDFIVQEKLDGANVSIWLEAGEINMGSRTQKITEGFNGFCEYVKEHKGIKKFFEEHPDLRLYGEWLVRHTISYNETAYKKFYLYDILLPNDEWMRSDDVQETAITYDISFPTIFHDTVKDGVINLEEINAFTGKTELGKMGEGIVIKNVGFVNSFGDHAYAKIVTQEFKEGNALVFGGNNKHSETYWEMYIINQYATLARVKKVMHKLQPIIDEPLDKKHTPRITNTCYHDMITEEAWEIAKKVQHVDFKALKRLSFKKFVQIYHYILDDNISVADENKITTT